MTEPPLPLEFVAQVAEALRPGRVLDVACGKGRHLAWLAGRGFDVTGVDRDPAQLAVARAVCPRARLVERDLERDGLGPELAGPWDMVVMTFFLWRPLWVELARVLAPGGALIVETFHEDNIKRRGRPRRGALALAAGEARRLAEGAGLVVRACDEGERGDVVTTRLWAQKMAERPTG